MITPSIVRAARIRPTASRAIARRSRSRELHAARPARRDEADLSRRHRRDGCVVGDEHDRAARRVQFMQQRHHVGAGMRVEVAGRLVGQQERRVGHQRTRDRRRAAAGRRTARLARGGAGRRAPSRSSAACAAPVALLAADALVHQRRRDVVERGRARQQVVRLEDEADGAVADRREGVVAQRPRRTRRRGGTSPVVGRSRQPTMFMSVRLARARLTDDGHELAAPDRDRDVRQRCARRR